MDPHRGHVLLAEDDDDYRTIVTDWLTHSGFDVSAFASGDELLQTIFCDENPPFVVLTDLFMRGVSGFDIVAELRAANLLDVIPVAVHSATAAEVFPEADVLGIQKPVELAELAMILGCLCADAEKTVALRNLRMPLARRRRMKRAL